MYKKNKRFIGFRDIWLYYANLIGYLRIVLCIIATMTIVMDVPVITGGLIFTAILLDWIDGKVARFFNQSTIFGDGFDWSIDLFTSLLLLVWLVHCEPKALPWITLVTVIEVSCALFDFAIVATERYPKRDHYGSFLIILDWCTPKGSYSTFGTFIWISFPIWVISRCLYISLDGAFPITNNLLLTLQYALFLPALLCVWFNLALLIANIGRWREVRR